MRHASRTQLAVLTMLAVAVLGVPAFAQTPPPAPSRVVVPPAGLGLADALRLAMDNAPAVQRGQQDVATRVGEQQEARGSFDALLRIGPSIQFATNLLDAGTYNQELSRRVAAQGVADAFGNIRRGFAQSLAAGNAQIPLCPNGTVYTITDGNVTRPACKPVGNTASLSAADAPGVISYWDNFFLPPARSYDPVSVLDFQRAMAQANGMQVDMLAESARQQGLEAAQQMYRLANDAETRATLTVLRLGVIPTGMDTGTATMSADYGRLLRNGTYLQFSASVDGAQHGFQDKVLDPAFGGSGTQNLFHSRFLVTWTQPLRRGQGATSVAAAERAADRNLTASRFTYQHGTSEQARDTALAYLDLVVAQQRVALLNQSLAAERRLLDATLRSVAGGGVARADLIRLQARVAEVEADAAAARGDALRARAALAVQTGLSVEEAGPQLAAADAFSEQPPPVDIEALASQAQKRRADLNAAGALRDTARVLFEAARVDTRSRLDLSAYAGMGNNYYGPYFRVLASEFQFDPTEPPGTFVSYYNLAGIGRAFDRRWQPIAQIQLSLELPVRNQARLGKLAQARAQVYQADVHVGDVSRLVDEGVTQAAESVRRAKVEWDRRREALSQYELSWSATEKRRLAGDMTMIDTLQTERDLTQARLSLLQTKYDYCAAVTRLRYETGTLVNFGDDWRRAEPQLAGLLSAR